MRSRTHAPRPLCSHRIPFRQPRCALGKPLPVPVPCHSAGLCSLPTRARFAVGQAALLGEACLGSAADVSSVFLARMAHHLDLALGSSAASLPDGEGVHREGGEHPLPGEVSVSLPLERLELPRPTLLVHGREEILLEVSAEGDRGRGGASPLSLLQAAASAAARDAERDLALSVPIHVELGDPQRGWASPGAGWDAGALC